MKLSAVCTGIAALLLSTGLLAREPFKHGDHFHPEGETEKAVWDLSREMHRENVKRRTITAQRTPLDNYLQRVMDRLYPEFPGRFNVRWMKSAGSNAFALPSGEIYVGGGLLMRMTSEAQLAALLAHEGSHVTHRHGVESVETAETLNGTYSVLSTAIEVLPLPATSLSHLAINPIIKVMAQMGGRMLTSTSIMGFSRQRETEADTEGFARLVKAGYAPSEAAVLFRGLAAETAHAQYSEPFFFASHPAMQARVENFDSLLAQSQVKEGFVGKDEFETVIGPLRKSFVEHEFQQISGQVGRHRMFAAFFYRPDIETLLGPADAAFYKAEALLRLGDKADAEDALEAYRRAEQLGVPAEKIRENRIILHLRKNDGPGSLEALNAWALSGKNREDGDFKNYWAQAMALNNDAK